MTETTAGTAGVPDNPSTGSPADAEPVDATPTDQVDHPGTGPGDVENLPPSDADAPDGTDAA